MTFLYVGLGIVMISGISAMMQIGNNINNLIFLSAFKRGEYYQSSLPSYDRNIMNILNNYSGPDSDICFEVKESLNNSLIEGVYKDREDGSSIRFITPSKNEILGNSCVLVNNILRHRVLIKKDDNLGDFNLFSCYLKKTETLCPYEVNK